jgi:AraC-like DNA-binding protein
MNLFGTNAIHLLNVSVHEGKHEKKAWRNMGRNFHGITFRISGQTYFTFENGESLMSQRGSLVFIPQGMSYLQRQPEPSEFICFLFNSEELLKCHPFVLTPLNDQNFRYLFNKLEEIWKDNPEPSAVGVMAAAYKILQAVVIESETQLASNSSQAVLQALKYMRRNLSDSSMMISDCAEAAGVSEIYLRKLFIKNLKSSPGRYLTSLRIENAKNMLSTGYYAIKEIAERSGFSSSSYFCSVFKAYIGLSPMEYIRYK